MYCICTPQYLLKLMILTFLLATKLLFLRLFCYIDYYTDYSITSWNIIDFVFGFFIIYYSISWIFNSRLPLLPISDI